MKKLVKVQRDIPWLQSGEGRFYITDELPPRDVCSTAFGFVFAGRDILLTRLRDRDWDIPGGWLDPGEAPEDAAVREVREEACAQVEVVEPIGIEELERFGPKADDHRGPYPISVQVYYLCRLLRLFEFTPNQESTDRGFFPPDRARQLPTMAGHDVIYDEGLRRVS